MADIGVRIGVEGNAEFKRSIREINSDLKILASEQRKVTAEFDGNANSMEALTRKQEILTKQYDTQTRRVKELSEALENAKNTYGENDKEVKNYKNQLVNAETQLIKLDRELQNNKRYLTEAEKATDGAATSIDEYGKEVDEAQEKSGLLGKIFAGGFFANIATQALGVLTHALKSFSREGIQLSSDLQEVQNVVDVTFGEGAQIIADWANKAQSAFGLTELQAKKFSSTIGAMLKSAGVSGQELTDMSTSLAGVAADFASFYNLDIETAFDKIRQGISGETEGLKALGINLNTTNLMQTEYAQSLNKSWTEMTTSEQATVRYNALLEQGADAMGDFSRNSDSFANQQRLLSLEIDNLKKAIGDRLMPIVSKYTGLLIDLLGVNKSVGESMSQLTDDLKGTQGILALIEQYRTLTHELNNVNLSEEEATLKTAELEKVKKQLIEASGGVVTALDDENGTFGDQVDVLERATLAQQGYNQYKLEAIIRENIGTEANKDAAKAAKEYEEAQAGLNDALEYLAEIQDRAARGESTWVMLPGQESVDLLSIASERVNVWNNNLIKATEGMGKAEETSQQTTSALKTLIDQGFYSAEEAAEKFNLSMDEVNKILGATLSTTENLTAAEEAAVKAIESISAEIEILQTSYNEAFKSANEAIESHMGLWEQMDNSVVKSVEDIALALATQKAWLDTYNRNLVSLSERQISGVGDLVESLSDGTKESASILAGLASATDEEVSQIIYSLGRVGDSKDTLSHTMAGIATDFSKKMNTLSEKAETAVDQMNQSVAAEEAAMETMNSYIRQTLNMIPQLEAAYRKAAQSANQAYRDEMDMHSPSRKAMQNAKDYWDGNINETIRRQSDIEKAYAKTAELSNVAATPQTDFTQIGETIANAIPQSGGINQFTVLVELDGRQVGKATRIYQVEENSLMGIDLTEG